MNHTDVTFNSKRTQNHTMIFFYNGATCNAWLVSKTTFSVVLNTHTHTHTHYIYIHRTFRKLLPPSSGKSVHLRKKGVSFETSCVYGVVWFLKRCKKSFYYLRCIDKITECHKCGFWRMWSRHIKYSAFVTHDRKPPEQCSCARYLCTAQSRHVSRFVQS